MKNKKYEYRFTLLSKLKDGQIQGPMSPFLAAKQIAELLEEQLISLYRVDIRESGYLDARMYQKQDGERKDDISGHDLLLIGFPKSCVLFNDEGVQTVNLALCVGTDEDDVAITKIEGYVKQLTDAQMTELMHQAYSTTQDYFRNQFIPEYKKQKSNS